jgi:hypothetical protein
MCVHVISQKTKILNVKYKEYIYFGDEVETLCTKEKNYYRQPNPDNLLFRKKKLITKQSNSHNSLNAVVVPLILKHTYT